MGFAQFFVILVAMIKVKLTASIIGPVGIGLIYTLTNMTGLIGTITNFGLGTIAIKNISKTTKFNNSFLLTRVISTYWKLAIFTGSLGTLIVIIFSYYLSKISFGNSDYALMFIIISVTLLFAQINTGQFVVLQSLRYFKKLAYSNLISGIIILVVTVLIFYFYGIKGVAASIFVSSLIPTVINWAFIKKMKIQKVKISSQRLKKYGKELLTLGSLISLSRIMPLFSTLVLNAFIIRVSGLNDVGFYNAGFAIIFTYTGIIFTAMEAEYFSRLSTQANNKEVFNNCVNQQVELAILLIAPVVMLFVFFASFGVLLLYTSKFLIIENMIRFAMLGLFFKCLTWPLSYIFLVRNDNKLYFLNEFGFNAVFLILNIIFYNYLGIEGLGYSYFIAVLINLLFVLFILKKKYNFRLEKSNIKLFFLQFLIILTALLFYLFIKEEYKIWISIPFILTSFFISYYYLKKKIDIVGIINSKLLFFVKRD